MRPSQPIYISSKLSNPLSELQSQGFKMLGLYYSHCSPNLGLPKALTLGRKKKARTRVKFTHDKLFHTGEILGPKLCDFIAKVL